MDELIVALEFHPCRRILVTQLKADTNSRLSLVPAGKPCEHAHTEVTLRVGHLAPRDRAARPAVLVVDDDPGVCTMVRRMLAGLPWRILEARNGVEALALVHQERPSLLLLDVVMPRLDGWAVLEALQAHVATRDIPVVLISGNVMLDDATARGLGAAAVLPKPFGAAALRALVQDLLGRERAARDD